MPKSHTDQVGLCAQKSHFIFPYCYYTRGLSALDTLSLLAQSLESLFSFLKKEICHSHLIPIFVLFCFEPFHPLPFLGSQTAARDSESVGVRGEHQPSLSLLREKASPNKLRKREETRVSLLPNLFQKLNRKECPAYPCHNQTLRKVVQLPSWIDLGPVNINKNSFPQCSFQNCIFG